MFRFGAISTFFGWIHIECFHDARLMWRDSSEERWGLGLWPLWISHSLAQGCASTKSSRYAIFNLGGKSALLNVIPGFVVRLQHWFGNEAWYASSSPVGLKKGCFYFSGSMLNFSIIHLSLQCFHKGLGLWLCCWYLGQWSAIVVFHSHQNILLIWQEP